MRQAIVVPELGTKCAVVSVWYVKLGEKVYAGDRVVELLMGSATLDVNTEAGGVLVEHTARPDDRVETGQIVGYVETMDDV